MCEKVMAVNCPSSKIRCSELLTRKKSLSSVFSSLNNRRVAEGFTNLSFAPCNTSTDVAVIWLAIL